jgi:hypothetical protein
MEANVTFRSGQQRARLATLAFWASIAMAGVVAGASLAIRVIREIERRQTARVQLTAFT